MSTAGESLADSFLRAVRRRLILADLLRGSFFAAFANEAVRWGSVWFSVTSGHQLPIIEIGPLVLLALYPLRRRRWSREAVARHADKRAGLADRLVSFVDFQGRTEIPAVFRRAQAGETARAIAPVSVSALARISPWLAAGPVLLVASVIYPPPFQTDTETMTSRIVRRVTNSGRLRQPLTTAVGPAAGDKTGLPPKAASTPAGAPEPAAPTAAPPRKTLASRSDRQPARGERPGSLPDPPRAKPPRARPPESHPDREQPASIASERVGSGLAKVVDPVYTPGARALPGAPPPTGSFSFRLLPKNAGAGAGAGAGTGETESTERVTVDFDSLPEQYRPLVRSYFELLAQTREAPPGGNQPPARSDAR